MPAAGRAGSDIFGPVVQIKDLRASRGGLGLDDFIEPGVGLHDAVLIGQNVAVEMAEERKAGADVADSELVRVREYVGGKAALAQ